MAYKKSYRKNYRRRRRKPAASSWGSYANTAVRALSLASRVASMVNVEYKNIDTVSTATLSTTWQVVNLTLCAQGDDQTNRNGRSIKSQSLMMQCGITANATATVPVRCRLVLVKDNQGLAANPNGTDIFTLNGTEALRVILNTQNRFQVIWDRMKTINTDGAGPSAISIRKYFKMSHHIKYQLTTATQTANGPGSLFFLFLCDNATAGQQPTISYAFRYRFVDN